MIHRDTETESSLSSLEQSQLDDGNAILADLVSWFIPLSPVHPQCFSVWHWSSSFGSYPDTLVGFHCPRAPEQLKFKLAVFIYWALHGNQPWYLSGHCYTIKKSSSSSHPAVHPACPVSVGNWSFASAGFKVCNSLLDDIISCQIMGSISLKTQSSLISATVSPYSIMSIGHGADPDFLALSPQMTLVTNPVVGCHYFLPSPQLLSQPKSSPLAGTKLYCLVTEAHRCK